VLVTCSSQVATIETGDGSRAAMLDGRIIRAKMI
jgi:hypothetical protein